MLDQSGERMACTYPSCMSVRKIEERIQDEENKAVYARARVCV